MSKLVVISGLTLSLPLFADSVASKETSPKKEETGATTKLEIKRFRFQRHARQDFERLVLEFGVTGKNTKAPSIKITTNGGSKPNTVLVESASLVGSIPESAINDAFGSKATYLGTINVSTDNTSSFHVKANLKDSSALIDAFWLESPSRLVLDVYPPTSPRAAGPAILEQASKSRSTKDDDREVAQNEITTTTTTTTSSSSSSGSSSAMPAPEKKGRRMKGILCFTASQQLTASVSFVTKGAQSSYEVETDGTSVATPTVSATEGIVCYPKSAQVVTSVKFKKDTAASLTPSLTVPPTKKSETKGAKTKTSDVPKPTSGKSASLEAPSRGKGSIEATPSESESEETAERSVSSAPPMAPVPGTSSNLTVAPTTPERKPEQGEAAPDLPRDTANASANTASKKSSNLLPPLQ